MKNANLDRIIEQMDDFCYIDFCLLLWEVFY